MAYGAKYRHSYCNEYGVNSTITILENGYNGAVRDVDAQVDPIVISQEASDTDKFDPIRPSTASIGLIGNDTFTLAELFTADERKYMVENHVGGVLVWRGFVIPNGFSHEWTGGEFPMEIIASDNLSTLKDFPFLNDNGTIIKGRLNHVDILLKCLNKLDIGIDLLTLTNITRQGGSSTEDPLFINTTDAYAYLNTNVKDEGVDLYYDNPQNAMSCYDVVESICRLYGAKLYQNKGQWRFKRVNVDYGTNISGQSFHRYNSSGVKIGMVSYNDTITIPCIDYSGSKAQYAGARLSMSEVYKSASVMHRYRYLVPGDVLPPIIKNQNLNWSGSLPPIQFVPIDWEVYTLTDAGVPINRTVNIQPEVNPLGDFPPGHNSGVVRIWGGNRFGWDALKSHPVSDTPTIQKGDKLSLSFWHKTPFATNGEGWKMSFLNLVRVYLISELGERRWALRGQDSEIDIDGNITLHKPSWVEMTSRDRVAPAMAFYGKPPHGPNTSYQWIQEHVLSSGAPSSGFIYIEFAGIGEDKDAFTFPQTGGTQSIIPAYIIVDREEVEGERSIDYELRQVRIFNQEYKVGAIEMGVIPESSNRPTGRMYDVEQSAKYSQRGEVVSLLTSDINDKDTINNVLTNGNFVNQWNDSRNPYSDYKPLGLVLSRDIMRQYKNVWRVIEEDIKANGLSFDTTIEFEERPGERYAIQRGSISQKFNRFIGCTLIQVSSTPDPAFVGNEGVKDVFSNESSGTGGGGTGYVSSGSSPQNLQSVTDVGDETDHVITARGVRAQQLLEVPGAAPLPADMVTDKVYVWGEKTGNSSEPSPVISNLEDLQNVADSIPTGQYLFKDTDGIWKGKDIPVLDLSGYAKESWVTSQLGNYVPASRTVNGKPLTGNISLTASDVGAITQAAADGRYVTIATKQEVTGAKRFSKALGLPDSVPVSADMDAGAVYIWSDGTGGGSTPSPSSLYLEDLLDVNITNPINKQVLQWNGTRWVNGTVDIPSLAGYAKESWVEAGYYNRSQSDDRYLRLSDTRISNWNSAYNWGDFRDFGLGVGANNRVITNVYHNHASGLYGTDVDSENVPLEGSSGSLLVMQSGVSVGANSFLWILGNNLVENRAFITHSTNTGILRSWNELWHDGNLRSDSQNDARYSQLGHTHTFGSLTSKPTTLSGYGITDAVTINTKQSITGAKRFTAALGLPSSVPSAANMDTGVVYVWSDGAGGGSTPSPSPNYLRDLLDVTITSPSVDQVLQWNGTRWVNGTVDIPSLAGYAKESWVEAGYYNRSQSDDRYLRLSDTRISNWNSAYNWGDFRDFGLGVGANNRVITNVYHNHASGLYGTDVDSENVPLEGSSGSLLVMQSGVSVGANSFLWILGNNLVENRAFITHSTNTGILRSWNELWHDGNLRSDSQNDARYSQLGHTHTFGSLTSKPTTLSGYGITDAVTINTKQSITGAKRFTAALGLPSSVPSAANMDTGVVYVWSDGAGGGSTPSPSPNYLRDLLDVTITSPSVDQVLRWNGTRWVNSNEHVPSLAGYAKESWVQAGYYNRTQSDNRYTLKDADLQVFSYTNSTHPYRLSLSKGGGSVDIGYLALGSGLDMPFVQDYFVPWRNEFTATSVGLRLVRSSTAEVTFGFDLGMSFNSRKLSYREHDAAGWGTLKLLASENWVSDGYLSLSDSRISNWNSAYNWGDYRDWGLGSVSLNSNLSFNENSSFIRNINTNNRYNAYGAGIQVKYGENRGVQLFITNFSSPGNMSAYIGGLFDTGEIVRELWHSGNSRSNTQNDSRYLYRAVRAVSPLAEWDTISDNELVRSSSAADSPYQTYGVGLNINDGVNYRAQIFFSTGNGVLQYRTANSTGWTSVRTLWNDGNHRSDTQNDLRYLLLTGGVINGDLSVVSANTGSFSIKRTNATGGAYMDFLPSNQEISFWRVGAREVSNGDFAWYVNGTTLVAGLSRAGQFEAPIIKATRTLGLPKTAPPAGDMETGVVYIWGNNT